MKISRKTWVITGAGFIAIVLITLGVSRLQQIRERDRLEQTKSSGLQVAQLTLRQADLDRQLTQAQSQLDAVRAIFSKPLGDVVASGVLFNMAKVTNVTVAGIVSTNPTTEKIGKATFDVTCFTAKVEGDLPSIVSFIIKLNDYFGTGVVRTIRIDAPSGQDKASASVQLVIYTLRQN